MNAACFAGSMCPISAGPRAPTLLSTAFPAEEQVAGGVHLPLKLNGGKATVAVPGIRKPGAKGFVTVPLDVVVDASAKSIALTVQGKTTTIKEGEWSEWVEWTFALSPSYSVRAISRYFATEVGDTVRLYMTCLQMHPEAPYIPISTPCLCRRAGEGQGPLQDHRLGIRHQGA